MIARLPDLLIDQIAAGEVVERPASVLKECIENSLDAAATSIEVSIDGGGIDLLRISDDGDGIAADELPLALTRHATSKIASLSDLDQVGSFGFRGEALAAIAAVSRLTLTSRRRDAAMAATIRNDGLSAMPAALAVGTVVDVRDLYYNTPARRKFLKSVNTETGHCLDVFRRLALAWPTVAMQLTVGQKCRYRWPAATLKERVVDVLGAEFIDDARVIEATSPMHSMQLSGYALSPTSDASVSGGPFFFVNGRFVRDRILQHAVREAYQDVLHLSRQPAVALFLDIDPDAVDVNVHPAKTEIRFREPQAVHQFVFRALEQALAGSMPATHRVNGLSLNHTQATSPGPEPASPTRWQAAPQPTAAMAASITRQGRFDAATLHQGHGLSQWQRFLAAGPRRDELDPSFDNGKPPPAPPSLSIRDEPPTSSAHTANGVTDSATTHAVDLGQARCQVFGAFILAESTEGLIVVDMHAAHERVVYERLKTHFTASGNRLPSQTLLLPITLTVSPLEASTISDSQGSLDALGLAVSVDGDTATVSAAPVHLSANDIAAALRLVLSELQQTEQSSDLIHRYERLLASLACHSAVRANDTLSLADMDALLRQMEHCVRADQCNHGRPTWVMIGKTTLDRLFQRGQ